MDDKPRARKPAVAANEGRTDPARRSNLLEELVRTREAEHRSVRNLADMAGVKPGAIRDLENGRGPVSTLLAVMAALPLHLNGLAPGRTFGEQLRAQRVKRGLSPQEAAAKASLSETDLADLASVRGCGVISRCR